MKNPCGIASLALLAATTLAAHADTVFSQFGPDQTFSPGGYDIGLPSPGSSTVIASSFTPTETATLTDAVLAMSERDRSPDTNPVTVFIESSVAGAPGSIIDTLTQVGTQSKTASLIDFTCASCSVLNDGTMYFLVAYQSGSQLSNLWNTVPSPAKGTIFFNFNGSPTGPWSNDPNTDLPAFEVNGTPSPTVTPEPASFVLLSTGILGLANTVRRKLVGVRDN